MKPEQKSLVMLGITRSKAKMYEYNVPLQHHIEIIGEPGRLFPLTLGILGDLAASMNRGEDADKIGELEASLSFSARFFDSYLNAKFSEDLDAYLVIVGSAAYYLCDLPGSSRVLAKRLPSDCPSVDAGGLEELLLWILQCDYELVFVAMDGDYGEWINKISQRLQDVVEKGKEEEKLLKLVGELIEAAYQSGDPRELLFSDLIGAVIRKKITNSSWNALPAYSNLDRSIWAKVLSKPDAVKELWPAQHLIGEVGILLGESAVVQMPTSAGKTKASELIIRSALLSERTRLIVIVAPFRALCHEIRNSLASAFSGEAVEVDELTDTPQADFEIGDFLDSPQVIVVTPEKLLYVLRHNPELAASIGLVIFDEGHQFDSGIRGITYELLLTTLRSMLPVEAQKVLISAVISNAKEIGSWLNGSARVAYGDRLSPTFKSLGFASWEKTLGRIEYVSSSNPDENEFFVPRVIESLPLAKQGKEKKQRHFPDRSNDGVGREIALYLGIKLVGEGSVAVFCGRKDTASALCKMVAEAFSRKVPLPAPSEVCDEKELQKLQYLIEWNLGGGSPAYQGAAYGIFPHHGNIPHGIRLAVEHAMRENLIRFVVCTSTLAQGVNLPIRYLIVTSVYQGTEALTVRDFNNLIGRAGRAGMHTEGSILFADPNVYDLKTDRHEKWRWGLVKKLLDPSQAESCISSLAKLFPKLEFKNDRSKSRDKKNHTINVEVLDFVRRYLQGQAAIDGLVQQIESNYSEFGFYYDDISEQCQFFAKSLASIEGFLLSNWDSGEEEMDVESVVSLAENTLAYFLGDESMREQLKRLFELLAKNIENKASTPERRIAFGRTLFGLADADAIALWLEMYFDDLVTAKNSEALLEVVWPLLDQMILNKSYKKIVDKDARRCIAVHWLEGLAFYEILDNCVEAGGKMTWGTKFRECNIDLIVDACEGGVSYEGSLIVGALVECLELLDEDKVEDLNPHLEELQKRLKYGLGNRSAVRFFELGFADRVIAMELAGAIDAGKRTNFKKLVRENELDIRKILATYPSYFEKEIFERIMLE